MDATLDLKQLLAKVIENDVSIEGKNFKAFLDGFNVSLKEEKETLTLKFKLVATN